MYCILIVEDDLILNKTLCFNLRAEGYQVVPAYSCQEAQQQLRKNRIDLVLLDINLPDGTGLDFCQMIKAQAPELYIIFLTANDQEQDQLSGYAAGGSDYITKPFSVAVLTRKLAAVFANMEQHHPQRYIYDDGVLYINFSEQRAAFQGEPLEFTPKEYRTLELFVRNAHLILTKGQLLEKLWDEEEKFVDEHTLTTMISRIRKKIEIGSQKYIKTAYGLGYQWIGGDPL